MVDRFASCRVLVVGDVMLDHFVIGAVDRISPEAPVPIVRHELDEFRVGGAANVAHNIRALGGQVDLVGVVGTDESARRLRRELEALGIGTGGVIADPRRRTTTKWRIVTKRNQQVARVDYETDEELDGAIAAEVITRLDGLVGRSDVAVISDYSKGVVTKTIAAELIRRARAHGTRVIVDPKIPSLDRYGQASLITPNHHEAEVATHIRIRTDDEAADAARLFRDRARCEAVLITRGERGMTLWQDGQVTHLPALAREVADVTGAGDTVVATLALALAASLPLVEAARLANVAASIVVGKFGPAVATPEELRAALAQPGV